MRAAQHFNREQQVAARISEHQDHKENAHKDEKAAKPACQRPTELLELGRELRAVGDEQARVGLVRLEDHRLLRSRSNAADHAQAG